MVKEEGGKIIAGGKSVKLEGRCSNGWFMEPTLVEGLSPSSRLNQEEIFGPVVTLQSFETESIRSAVRSLISFETNISPGWHCDSKRAAILTPLP